MISTLLIATIATLVATPVAVLAMRPLRLIGARRGAGKSPAAPRPMTAAPGGTPRPEVTGRASPPFPALATDGVDRKDPPVRHIVPADVAEFVVADFRAGVDRVGLTLNFSDIDFDSRATAAGVVAEFRDGDETLRLMFPGQVRLPSQDIDIRFEHPDSGWRIVTLAGLVGKGGGVDREEDCADTAWRVAAWAEAERALEAGLADDLAAVLPPLPEFHDFDPENEYLEIWIGPGTDAVPEVHVAPSEDGLDGIVHIGGRPRAVLCGAPYADRRNLRLVPDQGRVAAA